jgi:glycosyltransferase involved in cell wall biosynthesis
MRRCDLIIAISEFAAREVRRVLGPDCPPVVVCHLGLNPEYADLAAARQTLIPPLCGRRNILIVGRMADPTRDKGHEALIRALRAVASCVPNVQLVIVGRGGDEMRFRQLVAELELEDLVHFAGCVPDSELPAYYEAAEVFAMPSYAEGFGLVYLEAMFHRKPCIAGNRDGASEVVLEGETGLLVEPGNVSDLEEALLRLMLDPKWARRLGASGRARLDHQFTYEEFAQRFRDALESAAPTLGSMTNSAPADVSTYAAP